MTDGNLVGPSLCLRFQGGRKGQDREQTWTTAGETGADVKAGELDGHRWSRGPGNYREADEDSSGNAGWNATVAELSGEAGFGSFSHHGGGGLVCLFCCFCLTA